ncbi:hypothetical protein Bca4012_097860 [Brassica carinata]
MMDTEASHRKLSDGSSSINLNITSSPIEGGDCNGRGLSKEVKAVEDLVFFYSLRAPRPFFSKILCVPFEEVLVQIVSIWRISLDVSIRRRRPKCREADGCI